MCGSVLLGMGVRPGVHQAGCGVGYAVTARAGWAQLGTNGKISNYAAGVATSCALVFLTVATDPIKLCVGSHLNWHLCRLYMCRTPQ